MNTTKMPNPEGAEIELHSLELQTAIQAVKAGAEKVRTYYNSGIGFDHKSDNTIITTADPEGEEIIISKIRESFPNAHILGEEGGGSDRSEKDLWLVDPIDSTRSFSRGIPTWDVMVGYQRKGEMVIGVSYFPELNMLFSAEKGKGAFLNGEQIHVSSIDKLGKSLVGHGSPRHFPNKQLLVDLIESSESVRSPDPIFTSGLIAKGSTEGLIDYYGMPWDFAPWKVIVEEAGGKITKLNGEPWIVDDSKGCVLSNGLIHDELLAIVHRNQ